MFLTINHAKLAANLTVKAVTYKYTKAAIIDNTKYDEDSIVVKVASGVVADVVADNTRTHTDRYVDKINDWRIARKNKNTPEEL